MKELIFIHGWLGTPTDWTQVVDNLAGRDVRCLSIPRSPHWEAGVKRLLCELPEVCILVGYSLGARLALACALTEPDRVSGLVMVSGNPGLPAAQRAARWEHDQQICTRLLSQSPQDFLNDWYRQPVFRGLTAEWQERLVYEKSQVDREYQAALLRSYSIGRQPDYWPGLGTLRIPVLIVVGQQDTKYVAMAHGMAEILPHARVHVVPQSGHVVHREQPHSLAAAIRESLNWLTRGRSIDG